MKRIFDALINQRVTSGHEGIMEELSEKGGGITL